MKSSGEKSGTSWTLSQNGLVGTYIRLDKPGDVSVTVHASPAQEAKWSVVVADMTATKFALPAGTYFVRVQSDANSPVRIDSLDVTGATIVNQNTDANALAAADSYIANFRRGSAKVKLTVRRKARRFT